MLKDQELQHSQNHPYQMKVFVRKVLKDEEYFKQYPLKFKLESFSIFTSLYFSLFFFSFVFEIIIEVSALLVFSEVQK